MGWLWFQSPCVKIDNHWFPYGSFVSLLIDHWSKLTTSGSILFFPQFTSSYDKFCGVIEQFGFYKKDGS